MRDAFGVQTEARYSGIIESDGLPTRPKLKNVEHIPPEEASNTPTPDEKDKNSGARGQAEDRPRIRAGLGLAAAGAAGHAGTDRNVQAHHVRGDQPGPQSGNRRPGRPVDVRRRLQGALRPHPPADPEACRRRSRRRRCGSPSSVTPRQASCRREATMARSTFRPTVPTRCAKSSSAKGCRPRTSLPFRARPTASRCFPTIRRCRQTAA